ncbi:MAG TPA: class I SAM-dependent methyltransferase [Pyrinomonadaceae bacterium]|nr:class I SAM-dependent methyltransferase [Pyrinomonadaceae bacterium]
MNPSYGTQAQQSSNAITVPDDDASAALVSFRDPAGRVFFLNERVLRVVAREGLPDLERFLNTELARALIARGQLVKTTFLDSDTHKLILPDGELGMIPSATNGNRVVEHERISPRSFPYEWSPRMLHAAGSLTLDLADAALDEGFSLKDATPYNVLFQASQPIFVDVLSFESREPNDPTWLPFNQFIRTILLPLLVNKHFGLRLDQLLLANREGLEPADVAKLCGPSHKLKPVFLSLVFLPSWLGNKGSNTNDSIYQPRRLKNPEQAKFILKQQLKRLRRQLTKLEPARRDSDWSQYMSEKRHFSDEYLQAKESFVSAALENAKAQNVLDVGCNTGHFSRLAARNGSRVVAIDQDPAVVDAVWTQAVADKLNILPLVVNLARPTPAVGWRNQECPSFLERARGSFDLVLMLAVLHHLLVSEQIPLPEILRLAAELTTESLVIEFVAPNDPMFRSLVRGREELYRELTPESFERVANEWFEIVRVEQLSESRSIYLLRKRNAAGNV